MPADKITLFNFEAPVRFKDVGDGTFAPVFVEAANGLTKVAASASKVAAGAYIEGILIVPTTAAPGAVSIADGVDVEADAEAGVEAFTAPTYPLYTGGADQPLTPIWLPIKASSVNAGGFLVTTGANVSVIVVGRAV